MRHSGAERPKDLVFVSYSHQDKTWLQRVLTMLKPLVRNGSLDVWADEYIPVGNQWRREIDDIIERSTLALLLVTPDFLASDFIMQVELPALLAREVRLVWVLVRPCLWTKIEALTSRQCAHDPRKALSEFRNWEATLVRICQAIDELLPPSSVPDARITSAVTRGDALRIGATAGPLNGVPAMPRAYVEPADLRGLKEALLDSGSSLVGITGNTRALGLHGQGGIGKTVLAAAIAQDADVTRHFPDGVFWVSLGEGADVLGAQIDLLRRIGGDEPKIRSVSHGIAALRSTLADRRLLLVVDDVWSDAAAKAFDVVGRRGRVLYTTRDDRVLWAVGAHVQQVEVLTEGTARKLLASLAGTKAEELPVEADVVMAGTGRVALGLALVGAAVGSGARTWREAARQLEQGRATYLDHPYANTFKAMQVAVSALPAQEAAAYRSLAVYPEDTPIAVQAIARLWDSLWDWSPDQARALIDILAQLRLVVLDGNLVTFHDLQRDFLLLEADDVVVLHADLIAAYRGLLAPESPGWSALPPDEPYIWDHLVYHLRGAGERTEVAAVATDPAYLASRIASNGVYAAEADVAIARTLHPGDVAVEWMAVRLAQWGHLLSRTDRVAEVAPTLAAILRGAPRPINLATLTRLLPARQLSPRWGFPKAAQSLRRVIDGHARVNAIAFSPDGCLLATAGYKVVRLWETTTGQPKGNLEAYSRMNALAFSPDGRLLASAGYEIVCLWDSTTGDQLMQLSGHTDWVNTVAFSPDGRLLASAGYEIVCLWDSKTGEQHGQFKGHTGWIRSLVFSPDGSLLASAGSDTIVRLWNPATYWLHGELEGQPGSVQGMAFSPDGSLLASAGTDGVYVWDLDNGLLWGRLSGHTDWANAVAFSADGRLLASGGPQGVRLWAARTGLQQGKLERHTGSVNALAFSPTGDLLASADYRVIRLWDVANIQLLRPHDGHTGTVNALAFSRDGQRLASGGYDGQVFLWDPETGRPQSQIKEHIGSVNSLAFSPARDLLAGAGTEGVYLWDIASGHPPVRLEGHTGSVNSVAFSPDGSPLASAGSDGVRLWDPVACELSKQLRRMSYRFNEFNIVAFSPAGRRLGRNRRRAASGSPLLLAAAGNDDQVRLVDARSGEIRFSLSGHTVPVYALAFTPGGDQLATADYDGVVRLWDPGTGRVRIQLPRTTASIGALAFSPNGDLLASAGSDGLHLWDAQTGQAISGFMAGSCRALAWSPSGLSVAVDDSLAMFDIF